MLGISTIRLREMIEEKDLSDSPSTVRIADLLRLDRVHCKLLELDIAAVLANRDDGRVRALRNHHRSRAAGVLLARQGGDGLGDLGHVLGGDAVRLRVREHLVLVAEQEVPVGRGLVERVLEELRDEGRAEVQDEGLVVCGGVLGERHDRGHAHGQVEAADVVDLGRLDELPDLGRLEVLGLVVVCGGQISYHGSVVPCDHDAAASGWLRLFDAVFDAQAGFVAGGFEGLGVLVAADAADVENGVGWEDVLEAEV